MQKFCLKVAEIGKGVRLDQYLIRYRELQITRARIQRLIKAKKIFVNQKTVKAHYKIKENDLIEIHIPPIQSHPHILPERIPLDIVFEDNDILVINKPAGIVTHPALGNYDHTLVNALLYYGCRLSTINGPLRPGIVHRLDKDTSGLLVVAKNDIAHQNLVQQFSKHTVKRKYIALVKGSVEHNEGNIDFPIARDRQHRQRMTVSFLKTSRHALTKYRVLKRSKEASLVELIPYTGRTYQLRVHLKYLGHPILGDKQYGRASTFSRLALHARVLGFQHPRTDKFVEFQTDFPDCFKEFLEKIN
jgi:23S rRNA pseudouridine1911/1915/1917 synthase